MIIRRCKGCGAILQTEDEAKPGFINEIKDNSEYCKRCFRLMHYSELPKIVASNKDYENVIDDAIKQNGLMVFIVDIFAFKATFNPKMIEKLRNKNVILVVNKYDLFPKSTNIDGIVSWISKQCENIHFKVDAISVVSSAKGYFIDDLMHIIDLARRGRDVYFVGCANVGKSSLINALLKRNTSITKDVISTSVIPGTTLNKINIPFFEDGKSFIDTPGLINEHDVLNNLLPTSYKKIIPNKELRPKTYQITKGNSLLIAGLARIDFIECDKLSVILYISDDLYIQRSKTENVLRVLNNELGKLLNPPTLDEIKNIKYMKKSFNFDGRCKKDIWFSGFGFISIIGKAKIELTTISGTEVFETDGIIRKM